MSLNNLFGFDVVEDDLLLDGELFVVGNTIRLSSNYALQLERIGIWQSYVFVGLHPKARAIIQDAAIRVSCQQTKDVKNYMAKLFGFEVIINHALTKGDVFFNDKDEVHLSYADWKILSVGANSGFDIRAKSIYENIANKYGAFVSSGGKKFVKEIKLPDIEITDSAKDYTYLKICESCSDEKKCKRVFISNAITIPSSEQLFIDEKQLAEKTKFVCQYCFNYLKQTGVFE